MTGAWEQVVISAFVAAFVAGLFLLGGYYYNRRLERSREEEQAWQRLGMPVINAADDLIARLFDIITRGRTLNLSESIDRESAEIFNPSKELSTVWRLMHFFAASTYLEQHVADERSDSKISNLRYYTNNKSRIPLKGNLYNATFPLQTEGQQLIGSKVLNLNQTKTREIRDVDFFQFVKSLKTDDELFQSAEAARKLLNFRVNTDALDGQLLCVAQFCIYLIDLVQDLRPSSKWEEFRLYLVVLLRAHNRTSPGRTTFLYQRGDLKEDDYLKTFNILPVDEPRWYHIGKSKQTRRNSRILSRAKTGFPRDLSSLGVKRSHGDQVVSLNWKDSPGDVGIQLNALFK